MQNLSNQQRLHLVNTRQIYASYLSALRHLEGYRYALRWKTVRGVEYLFRPSSRVGDGRSLGRRSPALETVLALFEQGRADALAREVTLRAKLEEQARLNKALRLGRVPRVVSRILRQLDVQDLLGDFLVLGTQALYAFEVEAGVHFLLELLASGDIDRLYDTRKRLTLVSDRLDREGLLGLLKKADRSFEPLLKRGFRAANAEGFMVDLIIAPRRMHEGDPITFAEGDLVAAEVPGLQWLVNSLKLTTVAVDETGWPVPMRVPDPRAFALHKAWLSNQANREPLKRQRDLAQARAVATMVREHLPHLSFDEALTALHGDVRAMADALAE
ncbi:MAG: nucleotidyltransferase domain-containing protein [Pseudomonadota bacterium]|nr:nucleotidyltransferase domain-containing protein [Pseudomonadota bacterium]